MCKFPLLSFRVPGPGSPSRSRPGVEKRGQDVPDRTESDTGTLWKVACHTSVPRTSGHPLLPDGSLRTRRWPWVVTGNPRGWASGAGPGTLSSGPVGPIPPQNKQPRGKDRLPEGGPLPPLSGLRACPQLQASPGSQVPLFPAESISLPPPA